MKVIHTVGSIMEEASGVSYTVTSLAKACHLHGLAVQVFSVGPAATANQVQFVDRRFSRNFESLPVIRKLYASHDMLAQLRNESAHIIHTNGLWLMPNVYGAWIKRRALNKFVLAPHGMLSKFALSFSPWRKRLFGALFQWKALADVDMFHATSEQEYLEIRAYGYSQPVAIVPHGIDVPVHTQTHNSAAMRTLLYLGRIHPKKKLTDLVLAWSRLEDSNPNWRLRIVGPDELGEADRLRRMIESAGLKRVSIEAPLYGAEKQQAYCEADLFVLPTGSENFAMTVAESLASAVPVICTKGAPWAGLEDHGCGWWTDIGAEPIEKALREAMALSPDALHAMGLRGRAWMERDFSWAQVARQMEQAYFWLLGKGEKPACVRLD